MKKENNSVVTETLQQSTQTFAELGYTQELNWILPLAANILMMAVTFWVMIAFICYEKKSDQHHKQKLALNSQLIHNCVPTCALFCELRFVFSLVLLNIGFTENEDNLCRTIGIAAYLLNFLVLFTGQFFLWLRQRAFYVNRLMNVNYNKTTMLISYCSIFFCFVYVMVFCTSSAPLPIFVSSPQHGCMLKVRYQYSGTALLIIGVMGGLIAQVMFFGLLAYALTHVRAFQSQSLRIQKQASTAKEKNAKESIGDSEQIICYDRQTKKDYASASKVKVALHRIFVIAVISMLVDIIGYSVLFYFMTQNVILRVSVLTLDLHAFANLLTLIFSFSNCMDILTSPLKKL